MRVFDLTAARHHREWVSALILQQSDLQEIPALVFEMPRLRHLQITQSAIKVIPARLAELPQLEMLDLSGNDIRELPDALRQLRQLKRLYLNRNKISDLPEWIGEFSFLEHLYLNDNQLSELPDAIGQLKNLKHLSVQDNLLKKLSAELGQLTALEVLCLSGNPIARLPSSFQQLLKMDRFELGRARLKQFPEAILHWHSLNHLDLSDNKLSDIPEALGQLSLLRRLFLSGNKLDRLPESLGQLAWLAELHLDKNRLIQIPASLGTCRQLQVIKLGRNQIRRLPEETRSWQRLQHLELQNNALSSLPTLPDKLEYLDLSGNPIINWPEDHAPFKKLKHLSLANTPLSALPLGFRQMQCLEHLDLRRTAINSIPESFYYLTQLSELKGVGDAVSRKKLLRFLKICRHHDIPGALRQVLYLVFEEEGRGLAGFSDQVLLQSLCLGLNDAAYFIRKHLLEERYLPEKVPPLKAGDRLFFLGDTGFDAALFQALLVPLGVIWVKKAGEPFDYLVLGRLLRAMRPVIPTQYQHIISPRTLTQLLADAHQLPPLKERQATTLSEMIFSPDTANRTLAVQLLASRPLPPELITDLYLAWKMDYSPGKDWEKLLLRNASEATLRVIYSPLYLKGSLSESALSQNIKRLSTGTDLDGLRIAHFLYETEGLGQHYLRQHATQRHKRT
ncbi:MAG TPA: leucine-rich repeat domain-containing protein [Saprospiraceae bacterium]|nr:leucine-rich repeat domain-containing protein [Saprospiraceae bacterium]